jgi:hypothetical protein
MQNGKPLEHMVLDPRTMEAYENINAVTDMLLLFCKDELAEAGYKPYAVMFGMLMAASRIAAAGNIDPELLKQAIGAMYGDAVIDQREGSNEH